MLIKTKKIYLLKKIYSFVYMLIKRLNTRYIYKSSKGNKIATCVNFIFLIKKQQQ